MAQGISLIKIAQAFVWWVEGKDHPVPPSDMDWFWHDRFKYELSKTEGELNGK